MSFGETILRKYGWTQGKQKITIFREHMQLLTIYYLHCYALNHVSSNIFNFLFIILYSQVLCLKSVSRFKLQCICRIRHWKWTLAQLIQFIFVYRICVVRASNCHLSTCVYWPSSILNRFSILVGFKLNKLSMYSSVIVSISFFCFFFLIKTN